MRCAGFASPAGRFDVATRNLTAPDGVVVPLSGTEFKLLGSCSIIRAAC